LTYRKPEKTGTKTIKCPIEAIGRYSAEGTKVYFTLNKFHHQNILIIGTIDYEVPGTKKSGAANKESKIFKP